MMILPRAVLLVLSAVFATGCAAPAKKPYTIQGHPINEIALVAKAPAAGERVILPAGVYYPSLANTGFGFGNTYWMVYMPPQGIMRKGLFGNWVNATGGVRIDFDPPRRPANVYMFTENGAGSAPLPPDFKYTIVKRPPGSDDLAANATQARANDALMRGARDAAVRGVLSTLPHR
jgi:hypothetical protein